MTNIPFDKTFVLPGFFPIWETEFRTKFSLLRGKKNLNIELKVCWQQLFINHMWQIISWLTKISSDKDMFDKVYISAVTTYVIQSLIVTN